MIKFSFIKTIFKKDFLFEILFYFFKLLTMRENYELIREKEDNEFYVKSSLGSLSIRQLRFGKLKEKRKIKHLLNWLKINHPETMI